MCKSLQPWGRYLPQDALAAVEWQSSTLNGRLGLAARLSGQEKLERPVDWICRACVFAPASLQLGFSFQLSHIRFEMGVERSALVPGQLWQH